MPHDDDRPGVALVTGASRGIGSHLAAGLADGGWTVVGVSRSGDAPDGVVGISCDVTDAAAVERVVTAVVDEHGGIDLVVNNAGLIEDELPLWEADPEQWWAVMEVNVRGPFLVSRAVVAHMVAAGGGRVVNVNSGAGTKTYERLTAYCASKSALARITEGIDQAGADHGVRAFDLMPGVVATDMTDDMAMHADRTEWTDPREAVALLVAIAAGDLDAWSGRMVRAGLDTPASLRAAAAAGLTADARHVRLRPWGPDDPMA